MGAAASAKKDARQWRIAGLGAKLSKAGAPSFLKGYGAEDTISAREAEHYLSLMAGCGCWHALVHAGAASREAPVTVGGLEASLATAVCGAADEVVAYLGAFDKASCGACGAFALRTSAVPAVPEGVVAREAAADLGRALLEPKCRVAAVGGRAGNGKSVAAATCVSAIAGADAGRRPKETSLRSSSENAPSVAGAFVDGIAWVSVGQNARPAAVLGRGVPRSRLRI